MTKKQTDKRSDNKRQEKKPDANQDLANLLAKALTEQTEGNKALDVDAIANVVRKHGDSSAKGIMDAVSNGVPSDTQGVSDLLKKFGNSIPGSEQAQGFLQQYADHMDGKLDYDKVQALPGVTVDKKSKDVNLFGLSFLKIPPTYAMALSGLYTMALGPINGFVGKGGEKIAGRIAETFDLTKATKGRIAMAGSLGAVLLTTHAPDVNIFIQTEKQYGKERTDLTNRLSPILDDVAGGHSVAHLFGVRPEQNQMVFNERRRLHVRQNARRVQNTVQAVGRNAAFWAYRWKHGTQGIEKKLENFEAMSKDEVINVAKSASNGTLKDFADPLAASATFAAGMLGNMLFGGKTEALSEVSAFDMIVELKKQVDRRPAPEDKSDDGLRPLLLDERYQLPEGMQRADKDDGDKPQGLRLADYITHVFRQHEKDSNPDARISSRLEEDLRESAVVIARALRAGDLDTLALVKLVGGQRLVMPGGKALAPISVAESEVERLKAKGRYRFIEMVDGKRYFADSSFTPEQLKASWQAFAPEERSFMTTIVSKEALVEAGVDGKEIAMYRQDRNDAAFKIIADLVQGLDARGEEWLRQHHAASQDVRRIQEGAKEIRENGVEAVEGLIPGPGRNIDIRRSLANVVVHHGMVSDLLQHQQEPSR